MKKIFISLGILIISNANADLSDNEFKKCSIVEDNHSRLECFDKLTKGKELDSKKNVLSEISDKGKWNVETNINPVNDSKTVTLRLEADSGISKWGERIIIIARCKSKTTDIYINWDEYIGNEAFVLTRLGNKKAVTRQWGLSTDSKSTFNNAPLPFLKEMINSDKLVAQITPYNESPVTAVFDLKGLNNAIKPLRETCRW